MLCRDWDHSLTRLNLIPSIRQNWWQRCWTNQMASTPSCKFAILFFCTFGGPHHMLHLSRTMTTKIPTSFTSKQRTRPRQPLLPRSSMQLCQGATIASRLWYGVSLVWDTSWWEGLGRREKKVLAWTEYVLLADCYLEKGRRCFLKGCWRKCWCEILVSVLSPEKWN